MFLCVLQAGMGSLVLVLEKPKAVHMLGMFLRLCMLFLFFNKAYHFLAHADFEPPGYKDYRPELQNLVQYLVLLLFCFETECSYVA